MRTIVPQSVYIVVRLMDIQNALFAWGVTERFLRKILFGSGKKCQMEIRSPHSRNSFNVNFEFSMRSFSFLSVLISMTFLSFAILSTVS